MDVPRSRSDQGDEDPSAVYERWSATFARRPLFNEAGLDDSPSQGAPSGAGAGTSKKVPRRKENYSKQQDLLLCSAFLNVTRDSIVATNQSSDTYWSRIHQYFNEHNTGPSRSRESVQHRWGTIQKDVTKFCSFKAEQDRLNRSGKTEADRITDALKAFHADGGKEFQFMHCWEVLRNENKWHNWMQGTVERRRRVRSEPGITLSDEADPYEAPERPLGRDSSKKRRSEGGSSSNNSAMYEVLQKLSMSKDTHADIARNATGGLIAVEQEKVATKKQLLLVKQEQVAIDRRRAELEEKRAQEESDLRIMLIDVSQLDPLRAAYFRRRQQEIIARQLQPDFHPGGPSSPQ